MKHSQAESQPKCVAPLMYFPLYTKNKIHRQKQGFEPTSTLVSNWEKNFEIFFNSCDGKRQFSTVLFEKNQHEIVLAQSIYGFIAPNLNTLFDFELKGTAGLYCEKICHFELYEVVSTPLFIGHFLLSHENEGNFR